MKNIFNGWFKPKVLPVRWPMLLFHWPAQASYHHLFQGYLMLINCVNFMLLILKQHLLSLYRFTIK